MSMEFCGYFFRNSAGSGAWKVAAWFVNFTSHQQESIEIYQFILLNPPSKSCNLPGRMQGPHAFVTKAVSQGELLEIPQLTLRIWSCFWVYSDIFSTFFRVESTEIQKFHPISPSFSAIFHPYGRQSLNPRDINSSASSRTKTCRSKNKRNSWKENTQKINMVISENSGFPPKSSILIGVFHCFHHPFWGSSIFGNTHMEPKREGLVRLIFDWKKRWFSGSMLIFQSVFFDHL